MADFLIFKKMVQGVKVAYDEIAGVFFQRIKLVVGADGVNGGDVSSANPLPVYLADAPEGSSPSSGAITPVNISGTITLGGTAQTLVAALAGGQTIFIKNDSSENIWFNETGAPANMDSPSHLLNPGDDWTSDAPITTAVSLIGATTGQKFTARKW